jgi:hypothetical protein
MMTSTALLQPLRSLLLLRSLEWVRFFFGLFTTRKQLPVKNSSPVLVLRNLGFVSNPRKEALEEFMLGLLALTSIVSVQYRTT